MMRALVAALFIAAAASAVAVAAGQESQTMEESQCWDCHAPGLWDPPMSEPLVDWDVRAGALEVKFENTWLHQIHDLRVLFDPWAIEGVSFPAGNQTMREYAGTIGASPTGHTRSTVDIEIPNGTQQMWATVELDSAFRHSHSMKLLTPEGRLVALQADQGHLYADAPDLFTGGWGDYVIELTRYQDIATVPEEIAFTLKVTTDSGPNRTALADLGVDLGHEGAAAFVRIPLLTEGDAVGWAFLETAYISYYDHESPSDPDWAPIYDLVVLNLTMRDGVLTVDPRLRPGDAVNEEIPTSGLPLLALGVFALVRRRR